MHDESVDTIQHYVDALLAGKSVAHTIVDTLPTEQVEAIAEHPELSWRWLCEQPDRDAATRILEHRFQHAFFSERPQLVVEELDAPEFTRDAASDPVLEQLAMRAVTALAWHDPRRAGQYYRNFYTADLTNRESVAAYTMCQRVLSVAPLWRRSRSTWAMPEALERFVTLQWVASSDALDLMIATLRADMTSRPEEYLRACDTMAAQHERMLLYIVSLTGRFLPDSLPSLGELGQEERARLDAAMGQIDAPMRRGLRFSHLFLPVLTLAAALSLGGLDDAALLSLGVLGGGAAAYKVRAERGAYTRLARPLLAKYLAEVGTPTECVVSWLLVNRKSVKRIKAFDVAIDADSSLDVLARLGRMARLHG